MIEITSKEDLLALKESYEVEFKKAVGKNRKGKLPNDFFETYSAMANTNGGNVFLGVEEIGENIRLIGIQNPEEVIKELFDTLNNPQKVNLNILKNEDINVLTIEQKNIIWIKIPRATRKQIPIYKGQNPLTGTYIRQGEGDYKCKEECVKRFLAEQIEDSRDNKILKNFCFDDIELSTFYAYRNIFKSHKPDHPFNALDDIEFLRSIGGYRRDRETGEVGLTLAGLLMFGKQISIEEVLPYYMVDYQERPRAVAEKRWVDRIYSDGTWSGNIFDFYRKVISKLYENLKVPFNLKNAQREEDTPIHQALREALINALVHADYSERLSILIVKRPDMFGFRNPGLMRIPIEIAIKGGESDCRNRNLQKMFMLIGYAEKAGSGIPKIFQSWSKYNWTKPLLYEKNEHHSQTLLELRTINLFDEETINKLKSIFKDKFKALNEQEITILATTYIEEEINHKRILEILDIHPSDASNILKKLTEEKFLQKNGTGKGSTYKLNTAGIRVSTKGITASTGGITNVTKGITTSTEGVRFYKQEEIPEEILEEVEKIITPILNKQRVKREIMHSLIIEICKYGYFSPELLSDTLKRSKDTIKDYISELVAKGELYPYFSSPNSPRQAYTSKRNENE